MMGDNYWRQPLKWNDAARKAGTRARVFCASMADVFEEHSEVVDARRRLFDLILDTPHLDWLLLTKRPENIKPMLQAMPVLKRDNVWDLLWPHRFPNVWIGTSVENQEQAEKRIPELLKVPARVRFLSCEPLLGPVDLTPYLDPVGGACCGSEAPCGCLTNWPWDEQRSEYARVHWVIAGGESGPNARPMWPDWVREIRDVCQHVGTAFHFKQRGEYEPYEEDAQPPFWNDQHGNLHDGHWMNVIDPMTSEVTRGWHADSIHSPYAFRRVGKARAGRLLDGRTWDEFPL
jgi:protein gp37